MLIAFFFFSPPGANFSPGEASVCRVNSTDKSLELVNRLYVTELTVWLKFSVLEKEEHICLGRT